jgi:hypothetical protein
VSGVLGDRGVSPYSNGGVHVPRDVLKLAERVFKDYPYRKKEFSVLDSTITALCHASLDSDVRGEGIASSEPERVLETKEKNKDYQWLFRFVTLVENAIRRLTPEELEIIDLSCWQELESREIAAIIHKDERAVRRIKNKVFRKSVRFFLTPDIIRH